MLAGSHASTGALAGVLLAGAAGADLLQVGAAAAVGAGAALLPDLDHPGSVATRSQGPVSAGVCRVVRAASMAVWAATRAPGDDGGVHDERGAHRHLTHTVPAAVAAGVAAGGVSAVHWVGAAVVLWVLVSLGVRGLGQSLSGRNRAELSRWATVSLGAGLVVAVVMVAAPLHPVLLGGLVAVGMVVHVLGDWLTRAGVPLAWPLVHRGKRWWMFRSPLTFAAGDCWQEAVIRWACWGAVPVAGLLLSI